MSRDSSLEKAKYFKQMICVEYNIVEVLLTIIRIIGDKSSYIVPMLMMLRVLTIICEDNMTAQTQLFTGSAKLLFEELNKKKPLIFSLLNRNIFLNNNKILYVNPDIFNIFMVNYKENAYKTFATMTEIPKDFTKETANESKFDLNELSKYPFMNSEENEFYGEYFSSKKTFLTGLLSWFSYNEFLSKLVEVHDIDSAQREVYDLQI